MGWTTEDGLHEGYLVPEFADGVRGIGVLGGGAPDDQVIVDSEPTVDPQTGSRDLRYIGRPAAQAIGWRILCDCRSPYEPHALIPESERWRSDLLPRVPSKALEDLASGRIFATDEDVAFGSDREDAEEMARQRWWLEHAGARTALGELERAVVAERRARAATNEAATAARDSGATWEQIGRAAGITRQSAQERWGS